MTSRERRKQILARKLRIAQTELATSAEQMSRSRGGRPLKGSNASRVICARVDPHLLSELHELTGRSPTDIITGAIDLFRMSLTGATSAEIAAHLTSFGASS